MDTRNKLLYPMLLVAAFSVTAFSMVGIATMTGKIPSAYSDVLDGAPPVMPRAASGASDARSATSATTSAAPKPSSAATCTSCGVVESIRIVEHKGSGTGLGAVAGGLTGAVVGSQLGGGHGRNAMAILGGVGGAFAGNEIEKNVKKSSAFQVRVRMDDGTLRLMTQGHEPDLAVGDRVRMESGSIVRRS